MPFTRDADLRAAASKRQRTKRPFAGLVYAHQLHVTIGQCVHDLALIGLAADPADLTVAAQYQTNVALLVSKDSSNAQMKALILALRKARQDNALVKFFPPTAPTGTARPYGSWSFTCTAAPPGRRLTRTLEPGKYADLIAVSPPSGAGVERRPR